MRPEFSKQRQSPAVSCNPALQPSELFARRCSHEYMRPDWELSHGYLAIP
jgi:hypothetical protein